jgi:two-component system OmpR family sensor kinase
MWMQIQQDATHITFRMTDQGVGIPRDERSKVFDRFYRLSNAPSTGSGLGLSIVWQIIQQHQASIEIQDGDQGQGCSFCIRFPALSPTA